MSDEATRAEVSLLDRLKRVNQRGAPEDSVPLRVAVLVAVVTAASATLGHGVGGGGTRLAVSVGIPGAFWFSYQARYRSGLWLKTALAVGVMVAFGSFLGSLGEAAHGGLAAAQLPLAELFCWVQLLHAFDLPGRRDLMFSLTSSLVLMAVAGVLSVSMELVPYLLVWGVAAAASLVLGYRSSLAEVPALAEAPTGAGTGTGAGLLPAGLVRSATATVAAVSLIGAVLFTVLPPAGESRAVTFPHQLAASLPVPNAGGLSNPSLGAEDPASGGQRGSGQERASFGYFGFTETMDTGMRGRPDNTLVMRVRSSRPDFWRGQTFDSWDGRSWSISDQQPDVLTGDVPLEVPLAADEQGTAPGPELVQTYYVERPGPNLVFGARPVTTLYFPDRRVFQLPDGTLRSGVALEADSVYTVVSRRPEVTEQVLRDSDGSGTRVPERIAARYTRLPSVAERVRRLAREATAGSPTTYDKVRALEAWLAANTRYTLDVPPLPDGADAVERFLFDDRIGFCEQIGSSLVVMLRTLGVPARLAVGYTPGERNPFTGLYEVRASDAHSWAEVWFPGVGWQSFDPTASVPLSGDGGLSRASSGALPYLASRLPEVPPWAVRTAVSVGVAVVAILAVCSGWSRARRRRRRGRPSWAEVALARLEELGAERGRHRRPSETAQEYATALFRGGLDPRLEQVGEVVTRDAFSGSPASPPERQAVEQILQEAGRLR